ncbi:MAG: hypothetical protein OD817_06825 [Gammaproteobacteria bacterium]
MMPSIFSRLFNFKPAGRVIGGAFAVRVPENTLAAGLFIAVGIGRVFWAAIPGMGLFSGQVAAAERGGQSVIGRLICAVVASVLLSGKLFDIAECAATAALSNAQNES